MAGKIVLSFFLGLLAAVLVVAGTIYVIDPFHYFRWKEPPHLATLMQRHSTAGQIRNTSYDTIILGNSTAARINQKVLDDAGMSGQVANLSMWGATLEENSIAAERALSTGQVKRVIWLVGNQQLDGFRTPDFPSCMYDPTWSLLPYCYLFNLTIFREAVELAAPFLDYEDRTSWHHDLQSWKSYRHVPLNLPEHVCAAVNSVRLPAWKRRWDDVDFSRLDRTQTDIFQQYERLVLPLLDAHPEVEFTFVFPPMFQIDLVRFVYQNGNFAMFYMSLVEHGLLPRKNVQVYDFRFSDLALDPAEYLDEAHFSEKVTTDMLTMIDDGQYRITSTPDAVRRMVAGTEAAVAELRRLGRQFRPCGGAAEVPPQRHEKADR